MWTVKIVLKKIIRAIKHVALKPSLADLYVDATSGVFGNFGC
jgi:hypothetical protein